MFLSKKTFILIYGIGLTLASLQSAGAQREIAQVKNVPAKVKSLAAPAPKIETPVAAPAEAASLTGVPQKNVLKTRSAYEIGTSYFMWNERLEVSNGAQTTEGFGNYAGFGINLDKNWTTGRWFRGASLGYAFGKASSGGFDTAPTFADGINRSWQATQVSIFSHYRFDTTFSGGVGLLVRRRDADWIPADLAINVMPSASTQVAGQLLMRWQVVRRLAFLQGYTLLNFNGSTMWTWSAQLSL